MASAGGAGAAGEDQPDPRARLMHAVAEEMDAIDAEVGNDDYQIGRVITIVEILKPGPTGETEGVGLRVRAGQFPWVALGMLEAAKKIVEAQIPSPE